MLKPSDTQVSSLGRAALLSPLNLSTVAGDGLGNYVPEAARIRMQVEVHSGRDAPADVYFEKAGPRENVFFDPSRTRAAIVTCGGLCPGLNNVVRSAFLELHFNYGVREVWGVRYGYEGLNPEYGHALWPLDPDLVSHIHEKGGTILGTSRGPQDTATIVNFLARERIDLLLCVGGDGTQRGANDIAQEAGRRGMPLAVVGIPKTIDNDIPFVYRSFGFITAVDKARDILEAAHTEARSTRNGIGLVKIMGRNAGFIAAYAALASQEVNFTLIPEVPFAIEGERGFLAALHRRIERRGHALILVAEGAGQDLLPQAAEQRDASGNRIFGDIGLWLRDRIVDHFRRQRIPIGMKYFDPSYSIRSVPANCADSLLCDQFARHAVHAGMAGKTGVLIGTWHGVFTHVPIATAVRKKKQVDPESELWRGVLAASGQPKVMK